MKYLIAGRDGQLAQEFIRRLEKRSLDFAAPDESLLDITDSKKTQDLIASYRPGVIINCAAYNLVDRAEQERDKAFAVNAEGPRILANAAKRHGAFFVHFSSDYVFDGSKESGLYTEEDNTNPLNEYGRSKLQGEKLAQQETERFLCLRLSWVFGEGSQNFIYKLTEWAKRSEHLKIACDEFSVPTWTETIADITLRAIDEGMSGLYHLTNSGFCSRYEWAGLILSSLNIKKFIRPVRMETFNLPARRPVFSAMSNEKISGLLNVRIPSWEEAVRNFLSKGKSSA